MKKKTRTRGEKNIKWIEENCFVPDGEKFLGQPFLLRDWQRDILLKIYDNPFGTRRAIISFGRKNGKTALAAALLLLHLAGREAKPNSQLNSAAQSREQAGLIFDLASKMVRMSPTLSKHVTIRDTAKQLLCPEIGTKYKALSAEVATSFGLSPIFNVHDELGQVRGPKSELFEALETAMAAHEKPLSIIISTQAPTENDLLSILIDDAAKDTDKRTVCVVYSADPSLDPFSEKTIRLANPAFGDFQNGEEVLQNAESARRLPSREADYRNLVLNQRVEAYQPFVSRSAWKACGGFVDDDFDDHLAYAGLDLSSVNDLTAFVRMALVKGKWHVKPTFWLPETGLAERSRMDRQHYDLWSRQGYLETTPGKTIEYDFVAKYIRDIFATTKIKKVAFDRWNFKHLKPCLIRAGFTEEDMETKFVEFGQGFASMSPALRALESLILSDRLTHEDHPVLNMCAMNAVVNRDPAGNRKLDKARSRGRIDGMVCLAMAAAIAETNIEEKPKTFRMAFV